MDLFCPHCSKRVGVPDDKAGQVMSCPLCGKQFMAPSLPPQAGAPPPPPPPPSAPAPDVAISAGAPPHAPAPGSEPAPLPVGEYARSCGFSLNPDWLVFVPPVCVVLIFFLSFFPWHQFSPNLDRAAESTPAMNLWQLSFTEKGQAHFLAYTILMFPCTLLAIAAAVLDKLRLTLPPQVAPVMQFKNLLVGLLLTVAFAMLCIDYTSAHFGAGLNPIAIALKLAFRLHFVAMLTSFALFWLHWRKKSKLPLPRLECRW